MTNHAIANGDTTTVTEDGLPLGTVTFLLTDIESSTPRWDLEPTQMAAAIELHDEILDRCVAAHGGVRPREQGEGDSIVAVFTRASDAVRAASDAQQALHAASWPTEQPIRVRIGLHAGEAGFSTSVGYTGTSIIRAARIRSMARGGEVLISDTVRSLAADVLTDEELLDLGPHELDGLMRPERIWRLAGDQQPAAPSRRSAHQRRHNLPAWPARFVGRRDEIATLRTALQHERVVTVVGPGGGGKTRLAHQVAESESADRTDGAWWLDLVTVADGTLVVPALTQVLDVPLQHHDPLGGLCARLAHSDRLIVLDNCEHLLDDMASVVAALTTSCPDVTVLATSRAPLGAAGELVWAIPPLADDDAQQLFVERARHVRHNLKVDDDTQASIAAICRRLDGIPLPIELAAARCKLLSPMQILTGLQDAIALLTGGARTALQRHQTIEASIAWSHGLLRPDEQLLLRRLSVFESHFSLDAVEAVCADEQLTRSALLDVLERLVDQSLVHTVEGGDELRFRLLETVRQFARHTLASAGGDTALTDRHTEWFAERGRGCWPLYVPEMVDILDRLEGDRQDILVALGRVIAGDDLADVPMLALGILPALDVRHPAEAGEWAQRVRQVLGDQPSHAYGLLSVRLAEMAMNRGDEAGGAEAMAMAAAIAKQLGDDHVAASALALQAIWAAISDPTSSVALVEEVEATCRLAGAVHDADSLVWLGGIVRGIIGDRAGAERAFERAARVRDECPRCASQRQLAWSVFEADCGRTASAAALVVAGRLANRRLSDYATDDFATAAAALVGILRDERDPSIEADLRVRWARAAASSDMQSLMLLAGPVARLGRADGDLELVQSALGRAAMGRRAEMEDDVAATLAMHGDLDAATRLVTNRLEAIDPGAAGRLASVLESRAATLALLGGDVESAEVAAHRALDSSCDGPWPLQSTAALEVIAAIHVHRGWDAPAARLIGAAAATREVTGARGCLEPERSLLRDAVATARTRLGDDGFEAELAAGAALDLDEAVAYAQRARGERRRPNFGWDSLTPTERQVAELAAAGHTNPQIAERLLMGRETVKTHMSSIFTKTGVVNRTRLAAEFPRA
jgi:predicted ATPase/class 3 adenylate cyclase/DNA-binding CsgD family transcriptional regulator